MRNQHTLRRALVTGASGFLGARLVQALVNCDVDVIGLDLTPPPIGQRGEFMRGSVTDAYAVRTAMEDCDTVFHLAALSDLWRRDPEDFHRVNAQGADVIQAAARDQAVKKLVYCSSLTTLVSASQPAPCDPYEVDERCELAPETLCGPYPASKRAGELITLAAARQGLNASIALPTLPVGPGDRTLTPPTRMLLDFLNGDTPAYLQTNMNVIHVDDAAAGLIATAERGAPGERYILGGDNLMMDALLALLSEVSGRKTPKLRVPYVIAEWAARASTALANRGRTEQPKAPMTGVRLAGRPAIFNTDKAARDLAFRARPAGVAIADFVAWARAQGLAD
ncbi:MAG: NAD-dependent epimerase/dehydratase family protein [Maricaulaceae bacterium]